MLTALTCERGLDAQDYKCSGCKKPIGMSEFYSYQGNLFDVIIDMQNVYSHLWNYINMC